MADPIDTTGIMLGELKGQLSVQVSPYLTVLDRADLRLADAIANGKDDASFRRLGDGQGVFRLQLDFIAKGAATLVASAASLSVLSVALLGSPPQVGWVDASGIVARVKRAVRWRWPSLTGDQQSDLMRFVVLGAKAKEAVSMIVGGAPPWPAMVRTTDFSVRPEASYFVGAKTVYRRQSHCAVLSRGGQGRALLTQRFRPAFHARFQRFLQMLASPLDGVAA